MADPLQFQNILDSQPLRSLSDLQVKFTDNWFPGGEAIDVPVIRIHDAAHQWANISPTERGELQQSIVDLAGTQNVYKTSAARGFLNSYPLIEDQYVAADFTDTEADRIVETLVKRSHDVEDKFNGVRGQESLPVNSPARLQFPPISKGEATELAKRGQDFYGLVGQDFNAKVDPEILWTSNPDTVFNRQYFSPSPGVRDDINMNLHASWMHSNGDRLRVPGGYDKPGGMSFGPYEARLNRPMQYTADQGLLMREADKTFRQELQNDMAKVRGRFSNLDLEGLQYQEKWLRRGGSNRYGLPDFVGSSANVEPGKWFVDHDQSIKSAIDAGTGKEASALQYVMRDPSDNSLMDVAVRARTLSKVKDAVKTGFNITRDVAGSIPLFDPEFRSSVERGDSWGAAKAVAADYAIGAAAAPVVGAGAGVLQRAAPSAAARVLPAIAGGARVGNPVAVVSQIGGDSRQTQAQVIADRQAAEAQRLRAVQARERGNSWNIGPIRIPTFGIPESGGLFVGGNSSGRPIGTQSTLNGKPVLWSGDSYGWQSPQSAAKLGVTRRPSQQTSRSSQQPNKPIIPSLLSPLQTQRIPTGQRNRKGGR
jgi:hypothetical protein